MPNPFSDEPLGNAEGDAVRAVYKAARELENILEHYDELNGLSSPGKNILDRCYLQMRRTVEVYLGNNHSLCYDAPKPGIPFTKAPKAQRASNEPRSIL